LVDNERSSKEREGGRRARAEARGSGVLVLGLGRFGASLATSLDRLGTDVLVVEKDADIVAHWTGRLPLVEADASNPEALEQLGARDFSVAVVAVGTALEASVLITGNLVDLEIPQIWAKAVSTEHGRILQRIGAHHVVFPESDAGSRVAHLVSGKLLDYIEVEDGFTIVKMRPPKELHGFTLLQSKVRSKYGVTIIGVKSPGVEFVYATPETRVAPNDLLIVSGSAELLERFGSRP
jgi:trk system potassium uptake protein TrkA